MSDPRDYCSKSDTSVIKMNNPTGSQSMRTINGVIDKIFDPLDNAETVYGSSGYTSGTISSNPENLSYEVKYDLINLEPDNIYDIYYRDNDKWLWDNNRKANTNEVAKNIQQIHDTIVVPLRAKVKDMFADKVNVFVENCFMCYSTLVHHKLDKDHLFSKPRAVLLRIEGEEKASVVYDEIVRWTSDDEDKDEGLDEEETIEPINYGLMKLCNTDKEKQLIYITLPFTQSELDEDELLSKNKSNFIYSESNDLKIIPETSTSTKIFPAYKNDNGVEDDFNELDDMEDNLEKLDAQIEAEKKEEKPNKELIDQLLSQKFEAEQEKDKLKNPNFDISDLEYNKQKAEELYNKFPTEENKKKIELATDELNKFPSFEDTLTVAVGKINSISVTIRNSLDITEEHQDYFNARKLIKLYIAIKCRETMSFNLTEEELEEIYQYRLEAYNSEFKRRYDIALKEKQNELYDQFYSGKIEKLIHPKDLDTVDYPTRGVNYRGSLYYLKEEVANSEKWRAVFIDRKPTPGNEKIIFTYADQATRSNTKSSNSKYGLISYSIFGDDNAEKDVYFIHRKEGDIDGYDFFEVEYGKPLDYDLVPTSADIPPVEIDKDTIDMSDIVYPNKEDIRKEKEDEFNFLTDELNRIYEETDIVTLDVIITDFPMNLVSFTDDEFNQIEKTEYSKFPSLSELVQECDNYTKMKEDKKIYEEYMSIQQFISNNKLTENIKWLLDDRNDFNEVRDFYYSLVKKANANIENIDEKIEISKKLSEIFNKKNFNSTVIPSPNGADYAPFIMTYLESEIELYTELNNTEKLEKLNAIKEQYKEYIDKKEYDKLKLADFKTSIYQFADSEYTSSRLKTFINIHTSENRNNDDRILAYVAEKVLITRGLITTEPYFENCNDMGKESLNLQVISNLMDPIYNDTTNWLESTGLGIKNINNKLVDDLKKLDNFTTSKTNILHNYLESFNKYMLDILYNPDMNVRINKVYKSNKRNYSFIDYGFEYIALQKQIGDSMNATDSEAPYRVRLKQDRVMMKRQLVYLRLNDVDKKISNYELESVATVDFGKLNRFKTIQNDILPELKRLKELKDNFEPEDTESARYEAMKKNEKDRLKFLYTLNTMDTSLLYRLVTYDVTTDYENNRGIFYNLDKTKDEKYVMYLEEIVRVIEEDNNGALLKELDTIKKEIAYIKNENNEKKTRKAELISELQQRKLDIQAEIQKRKTDKVYLHNNTRILSMESEMKMKYKKFIKIEYLPSSGVAYKFPFMLYDEFKAKYKEVLNLPTEISEYEVLDGYYRYTRMHYNVFNRAAKSYIRDFHSYWENIAYNPSVSTMTNDIKKYIILLDEGLNKSFSQYVSRSVYCTAGFIELDTILLTDNDENYTSGIMVKMRRTIDFKEDIEYFLFNMFKQDKNIIDSIEVKELDS